MNTKEMQGPFNFNQREVFFDTEKGEFWDPTNNQYLDHKFGILLIDLYFGHHKAALTVKKDRIKIKKKLLKNISLNSSIKSAEKV
jgi:hypothetical protein